MLRIYTEMFLKGIISYAAVKVVQLQPLKKTIGFYFCFWLSRFSLVIYYVYYIDPVSYKCKHSSFKFTFEIFIITELSSLTRIRLFFRCIF